MFCKNCGQELNENAVICPYCGVATSKMGNNMPAPQTYGSQPKKTNGMGIAGFVVGLIGMLGGNYLFLVPGIVGLILSIIGMVQMKKCNSCNGLAIAGLVIGIVSFIFWLIIWIIAFGMIISGEVPMYFLM